MKKVNTSPQAQARRQRALARFSLDPIKVDDKDYQARKSLELATLKSRCGV